MFEKDKIRESIMPESYIELRLTHKKTGETSILAKIRGEVEKIEYRSHTLVRNGEVVVIPMLEIHAGGCSSSYNPLVYELEIVKVPFTRIGRF